MRKGSFHFFLYLLIFGILFLQFPLNDSLPGNCDTWLTISLSNTYLNKIYSLLDGSFLGNSMFPVKNIHSYGEASPGMGLFFIIFKLLVKSDIWAIYFMIVFGFALNAIGANYLSRIFKYQPLINWPIGLFFAGSNFFLANIDDFPIFFYFFYCLSIYLFLKYQENYRKDYLYCSALVGGIQIYFSVYIFVFLLISLFLLAALKTRKIKLFFTYFGILTSVALPMGLFYLHSRFFLEITNPWPDLEVISRGSLGLLDFFNPLPGNLIYPHRDKIFPGLGFWPFIRRHAFIGFIVLGFGIKGLFNKEIKNELKILFFIGLFLALGPHLSIDHLRIPSPLLLVYKIFPLASFLRVPLRAFSLCTLALSIIAGLEISKIMPKPTYKQGLMITLISVVFLIENTPFPLNRYYAGDIITSPKNNLKGTILNLPSDAGGLTLSGAEKRIFPYNRELIYMNWQTQHKQNILNGANGYYPKSRIEIQKLIDKLPYGPSFGILSELGLKYIIFHKNFILNYKEMVQYEKIKKSPFLRNLKDDQNISIFEIIGV